MAPSAFHLELITPAGTLVSRTVAYVEATGEEGHFGILAGHQPGIFGLAGGKVSIRLPDATTALWNTGPGVLTVTPETVMILVQKAEKSA